MFGIFAALKKGGSLMKKPLIGFLFLMFLLLRILNPCFAQEEPVYGTLIMADIQRIFKDEQIDIFHNIIKPYLFAYFKDNGIKEFEDGDTMYQELKGIRLQRVDDEDKYLVHIEFMGLTVNNNTGEYIGGLKGQEILFLIIGGELKDFQDLSLYYIETPQIGILRKNARYND